ncbi:MAG: hypothetical protein P1V97_34165 [Planctomycetota bacterium]|nr:hypothetical protein [Planctomycetota bacterium]
MIRHQYKKKSLNLIELVVVLLILVALAGILIPKFSGILTQSHVAATTTNLPIIESTVQSRSLLKSGDIGDRFDSMIVDPSGAPIVAPYVPGNAFWEALTLTADDQAALQRLGITELIPARTQATLTDSDATSGSHDGPAGAAAAACAMRTTGEDASMLQSFNMDPKAGARYLALGIGQQCTLIGGGEDAAFSEPPVHFGDTAATRSNVAYTRYFFSDRVK